MSKQTKRSYQAPALEKGLDIIECLSSQATSQSLTEIAQALGRSHNEIYRMLACLEDRRYVMRDDRSGKYYLSLKLFHLSHAHSQLEFLRNAAIGPMRRLTETVRQACHLAILFEDTMMIMVRVRSPLPVTLSIEEGTRFPLINTISGRLLLACEDPARRDEILARSPTFQQMNQREQSLFRGKLAKIRARGSHTASSEITEGVTDVGVPVGVPGSEAFASLTLPCIKTQYAECDTKVVLAAALECAAEINDSIGLSKPSIRAVPGSLAARQGLVVRGERANFAKNGKHAEIKEYASGPR